MKAEEAYKLSMSEPIQAKLRADQKKRMNRSLSSMLERVKQAANQGYTETIHTFAYDQETFFAELDAFKELRKMNFKVKVKWPYLLSQRRIIWKHALTKPANDVMKGMLKDSFWTRIKKFFWG